jgi:hypothetical protein
VARSARTAVGVGAAAIAASCLVACGLVLEWMDAVLRPEFELLTGGEGYPCTAVAPATIPAWLVCFVVAGVFGALACAFLNLASRLLRPSTDVVGWTVPAGFAGFAVVAAIVLADYTRYWAPYDASGPHGEWVHCPATHGEWRWGQGVLIAIVVASALAALLFAWRASRMPIAAAARVAGRRLVVFAVAAAAGFIVFCAATLVLLAVGSARLGSQWVEVRLYRDVRVDLTAESSSQLVDVYAQPPLSVVGWLVTSAVIAAAFAIAIWGPWLIVRVLVDARGRGDRGTRSWKPPRIATSVFAWGIVALSAYSLVIFLWDWIEWRNALEAGITLDDDPKPGPLPAFDPWQIPLGIVAFAAIAAAALFGLRALRRRGITNNRKASP